MDKHIFILHRQRISTSCNQTTDFMDEHHVGCRCKFVYIFRHVSNIDNIQNGRRFQNIFTEGRFKGNMLSILSANEVCGKMYLFFRVNSTCWCFQQGRGGASMCHMKKCILQYSKDHQTSLTCLWNGCKALLCCTTAPHFII